MKIILEVIQAVLALLIIISIMLTPGSSQLGMAFGGGAGSYRSKRGLEKTLFYVTVISIIIFALISILIVTSS